MLFLTYILLGIIIAIAIGITNWKYLVKPYRVVLALAVIGFVCEVMGYIISRYMNYHNIWLFNLYMPLEPLFLGWTSSYLIKESKYKNILWLSLFLNFVVWLYEVIKYSLFVFANFAMICGCFLLVIVYVYVLFDGVVFNNSTVIKNPVFWLSLSLILYFGCDIPFMGMYHYFPTKSGWLIHLSDINQILNFIRYPLVAVSFVLAARQKKEQLNSSTVYVSG